MKKFLCLILSLIICLSSFAVVGYAEKYHKNWSDGETTGEPDMSDWIPWKWADETKAKGTPIDSSFLVEKPAGKHGFLKTDGQDFVFEDGTKFDIWGMNIGRDGIFMWNKEDLVVMADRLARLGFNTMRFHQWDAHFYDNIFGEGRITSVSKIDPVQLDKFHYFLYLLKERGIYWYFDVSVGKAYIPDNENLLDVRTYATLGASVYTSVFFDEKVQEAFIKVIGEVLDTVNPYTGMRGFDDPALACISLTNEYSFMHGQVYDDYDRQTITSLFNNWLLEKYETREALEKAWKEDGKLGLQDGEDAAKGTVDYLVNGTLNINNYLLQKNPSNARFEDTRNFIYDVQKKYEDKMKNAFKERYGAKCLFTNNDMGMQYHHSLGNIHTATDMDFVAGHGYKSHPSNFAYSGGTDMTGWTCPTRLGGAEYWRQQPYTQLWNKPYILSEWSAVAPIPYSAQGVYANSVFMSWQNWNSFHFAWYSDYEFKEWQGQSDFFASMEVADINLSFPGASAIFLRGDVKPAEDSYYITSNKQEALDATGWGHSEAIGLSDVWTYIKTAYHFSDAYDGEEYTPTPEALDEAYKKYENNEVQNDQFHWNRRTGLFLLDTEYSNLAAGPIGNKKIENDYSIIELENYTSAIALTSATEKPLKESESVLLTTISRSRNTGSKFDPTHIHMLAPGTGPQLIEPVVVDITIKLTDDIKVYALDFDGQRIAEVPVEKTAEGYNKFKADGIEYKAVYYEIVK